MDPQKTPSPSTDDRQDFHPEMTISPRTHDPSAPVVAPADAASPALPAPTTDPNAPAAPPPASPAPAPETEQDAQEEESGFFNPGDDAAGPEPAPAEAPTADQPAARPQHDTGKRVSWTASEFIHREKGPMWYIILLGVGLVLTGVAYLLSREILATVFTALVVILFGIGAARKPRQMQYVVDDHGVAIGSRHFDYTLFRSFTIDIEDSFKSINLMPMKRFMPIISIYYDPNDEDQIAEVLAAHLPLDTHKADLVEKLMRQIRF